MCAPTDSILGREAPPFLLGDPAPDFCKEVICMEIMSILSLVLLLMNLVAVTLKIVLMIVQFARARNG